MMIIIPAVTGQLQKSKQTSLTTQISMIEKAASNYALENPDKLDEYNLNPSYVSVTDLQNLNYLEKGTIKNPVTKEAMTGCIVITYNNGNSAYEYNYQDKACDSLKKRTKTLEPAFQTILNLNNPITTGDGLYEIDDEYVFRGGNPNNYLQINNTMYRILSMNKKEKTIKVILNKGTSKVWLEENKKNDYSYRLSSVFTYLNTNFYQTLADSLKKYVVINATWNIGISDMTESSVKTLKGINQVATINANVGLLSAYEYARVSLNDTCDSNYLDSSCFGKNYLAQDNKIWLLNSSADTVWYISEEGSITSTKTPTTALVNPVFNLKSSITVTGSGTKDEPFILTV